LQLRGISAQIATDGETALKIIDTDKPEIVVLDLMMPGLGGIETLKRIKTDKPDLQVIVLTGYNTERHDKQLTKLGVFCSIQKPCKIDNLIKKINDALEVK
jgi:DNA-binding NtrC family response regulator